jgi:hypothetical protein
MRLRFMPLAILYSRHKFVSIQGLARRLYSDTSALGSAAMKMGGSPRVINRFTSTHYSARSLQITFSDLSMVDPTNTHSCEV